MYHRYEHGQIPKQHNLRVIAEKCETTIEWLLTGKPPPGMRPNDETAPPLSATTEKGDVLNHTEIGILKRQPERIAALEVRVAALEQAIVRLTGKEKAEVE